MKKLEFKTVINVPIGKRRILKREFKKFCFFYDLKYVLTEEKRLLSSDFTIETAGDEEIIELLISNIERALGIPGRKIN